MLQIIPSGRLFLPDKIIFLETWPLPSFFRVMSQQNIPRFLNFLRQDLQLANQSIQLALKQSRSDYGNLAMVLWQYGLVNLQEFNSIYDWLEANID
jgi:hypothetical protein